jgi:hypothetical protein
MGTSKTYKQYPYIHAWGLNLGSFEYYRIGEAEIAAEDNAPPDAIHRQDFDRITETERERALQAERDGTAVVLRRDGVPFRVWYRVNAIRGDDTRERVTTMAERMLAGKPARG